MVPYLWRDQLLSVMCPSAPLIVIRTEMSTRRGFDLAPVARSPWRTWSRWEWLSSPCRRYEGLPNRFVKIWRTETVLGG